MKLSKSYTQSGTTKTTFAVDFIFHKSRSSVLTPPVKSKIVELRAKSNVQGVKAVWPDAGKEVDKIVQNVATAVFW